MSKTIPTWGYHASEPAKIFELKDGDGLPKGWFDSPARVFKPSNKKDGKEEAGAETVETVLAKADGNFMAFKSAAKKLLGKDTPKGKDDIVAALKALNVGEGQQEGRVTLEPGA